MQSQRYRIGAPSLHYKLVYGDPAYARDKSSPLPREHRSLYLVLFELPSDVSEEVTALCESFAITFAQACVGPVYESFIKAQRGSAGAIDQHFVGANVMTGLETLGNGGNGSSATQAQAGPSSVVDARLYSELSDEEKEYYGSFVQRVSMLKSDPVSPIADRFLPSGRFCL